MNESFDIPPEDKHDSLGIKFSSQSKIRSFYSTDPWSTSFNILVKDPFLISSKNTSVPKGFVKMSFKQWHSTIEMLLTILCGYNILSTETYLFLFNSGRNVVRRTLYFSQRSPDISVGFPVTVASKSYQMITFERPSFGSFPRGKFLVFKWEITSCSFHSMHRLHKGAGWILLLHMHWDI